MKCKFKKGDLINPEKFEGFVRVKVDGYSLNPYLESGVTVFHEDIALEVAMVMTNNEYKSEDLLCCFDPKIGRHVLFQILNMHATLINKKEDDKLKLTKDDIGNKFENKKKGIFEVVAVGEHNASLLSKSGVYHSCQLDGVINTTSDNVLVKRHDPRWWLSQLPDADLFHEDVKLIGCHNSKEAGWWYVVDKNGSNRWLPLVMPKLKAEDYLLSKITPDELREWQEKYINGNKIVFY